MFGNLSASKAANQDIRFDETTLRAIRLAHRRKWTTFGTLVGIIGIAVTIWVHSHYASSRAETIAKAYLTLDTEYQNEIRRIQTDPENPISDSAALHTESTNKFESFARENTTHPLGWLSALRAATVFVETKQLEKARDLLVLVVPKTYGSMLMQVRIRRTLAAIHVELGDYDAALAELDTSIAFKENQTIWENRLFRAQVLHLAQRETEALELLKELAEKKPFPSDTPKTTTEGRDEVADQAAMWLSFWQSAQTKQE